MHNFWPFYEAIYKLSVVKMVADLGLTQLQLCKDLSISQSALARWVKPYWAEERGESGTGNPLTAKQQRICAVKIENCQLHEGVAQKRASHHC